MSYNQNENDRVRRHTRPEVLSRIDAEIEARIDEYRSLPPDELDARIRELEQEWSMERYLEAK